MRNDFSGAEQRRLGGRLICGVKNRKETKTTPRFRPEQLGIWSQNGRSRVCECHSNLSKLYCFVNSSKVQFIHSLCPKTLARISEWEEASSF